MSADHENVGPMPLQPAPRPSGKNALENLTNARANFVSSLVKRADEFPLDVCQARELEIENDELIIDKGSGSNIDARIRAGFDRLLDMLERICPACMAATSQSSWDLLHDIQSDSKDLRNCNRATTIADKPRTFDEFLDKLQARIAGVEPPPTILLGRAP